MLNVESGETRAGMKPIKHFLAMCVSSSVTMTM